MKDIEKLEDWINGFYTDFEDWAITAVQAYRHLRWLKKLIEQNLKAIEPEVRDLVESDPTEFNDFKVTTRTSYQYKQSPMYIEKYDAMKEIEKKLKTATDMHMSWDSFVDENWEIIEPVEMKYTSILTYTKKD